MAIKSLLHYEHLLPFPDPYLLYSRKTIALLFLEDGNRSKAHDVLVLVIKKPTNK